MGYLNTDYSLIFSKYLSVFIVCLRVVNSQLQSPCSDTFQYEYDNQNNLVGFIHIPSPNGYYNKIELNVQISVGNSVQGFNGDIELISPRNTILQDLFQKKRIHYKLYFPYWTKIPPTIIKIVVNGNTICLGHPIDKSLVSVLTTISLQHTLTLSVVPQNFGPEVVTQQSANRGTEYKQNPFFINFNPPKSNKNYGDNPFFNQFNNVGSNRNINSWSLPNFNNYKPNLANPFFIIGDPNLFQSHNGNPNFNPVTTAKPPVVYTVQPAKEVYPQDFPSIDTNFGQRPLSEMCGRSVNANSLLVNGNRVPKGLHPWLAAIFLQNNEGLKFNCGGTLISRRHVITAAHCVRTRRRRYKPEEIWTVLGRENIQRWSNDGSQIIQAESTEIHPDYKPGSADADIAVIILSEEVTFSSIIRPICLWSGDTNIKNMVEKLGTVAGWGKDESGQLFSAEPRQLTFPVVSEETCLRSHPAFDPITSNRTFCAGYRNNSGPCNGDSGSGFLMQRNGRWLLRGIVSTSLLRESDGGCDLSQYVVFADVAQYLNWLLKFLN